MIDGNELAAHVYSRLLSNSSIKVISHTELVRLGTVSMISVDLSQFVTGLQMDEAA
jgi:hypothetical protein